MSRRLDLGVWVDNGKPFYGDLDLILRSNVLLTANSGGGKSWTLRRMIEEAYRRVPQIIIDPEGEFSTLRRKFDFVLVGKGGDTPADIRSAPLLAHRLLELGTSAIIDLFEMSKLLRPVWVAAFIQALVDAPKKLWRDLLVYVDEAHELAPESGHGAHESRDEKLCRHALIDLAAKGRKRGYGTVAATQRLGKLSKDFAAELKNVLIGQTFIDIDRERAAACLGIAKADKAQFFKDVKTLEPGAFHALGRAFTLEAALVTIGGVETEHPEAGRRQSSPPPPTAKIRHLLPQLSDLPKEAEQKAQTEKELKARITELEHELTKKPKALVAVQAAKPEIIERDTVSKASMLRIERLATKLLKGEKRFGKTIHDLTNDTVALRMFVERFEKERDRLAQAQQAVIAEIGNLTTTTKRSLTPETLVRSGRLSSVESNINNHPKVIRDNEPGRREADKSNGVHVPLTSDEKNLSRCARALLQVLAQRERVSDSQLAALSGYKRTSSTFANAMSELRTRGYFVGDPYRRVITEDGRAAAGPIEELPTGKALLDYWLNRLSKAEAGLLRVVYERGTVDRQTLSTEADYRLTSSTFANALSGIRTLELVHGPDGGDVTIADVFKE